MKNISKTTKATTTSPKPEASAGPDGFAIVPPTCGIDFLDQQSDHAEAIPTLQRKADPATTGDGNRKRPQNRTGLPDALKTGIESISGLVMDDVRVHYNSSKPVALKALAYAQGTDIHVGPGQERHLPHEAWHVVQQKQGRVKPTLQMKGGVPINDNQGLEHEADRMGAKALKQDLVQNMPAPVQRVRAGQEAPIQMTPMTSVTAEQATRTRDLAGHPGEFTTVGFEFDLAQTAAGNLLEGISHLEIAESTGKQMGLPFLLETDAGNVLEFVTPPYLVPTERTGRAAPRPAAVTDLIRTMQAEFAAMLSGRITTIQEFIDADWTTGFGVTWHMKEGNLGIEARNWSWRANDATRFRDLEGDQLPAIEIASVNPRVSPQVNIATEAQYFEAAYEERSRVPNNPGVIAISGFTGQLQTAIQRLAGRDATNPQKIFYNHMGRVLAQQMVVPFIRKLLDIQQKGITGQVTAATIQGDRRGRLAQAETAAGMSSYVKDVGNIWLKDDLISVGLGILNQTEWTGVLGVIAKLADEEELASIKHLLGPRVRSVEPDRDKAAELATEIMRLIAGQLALLTTTIREEVIAEMEFANRGAQTPAAVHAPLHDFLATDEGNWPKLNEHRETATGVRQDTFIKPSRLRTVTEQLGYARKRLHVMEIRNPDDLARILNRMATKART
jgi:hypothetical protein